MKRSGILNQALSEAVAAMGHGEIMMIVDAGFPITGPCPSLPLSHIAPESACASRSCPGKPAHGPSSP